ncbi:hypothetical protein [Halostella sp. PRR32]|nr:hypothetical protein [Halostella sp. PRR32]
MSDRPDVVGELMSDGYVLRVEEDGDAFVHAGNPVHLSDWR